MHYTAHFNTPHTAEDMAHIELPEPSRAEVPTLDMMLKVRMEEIDWNVVQDPLSVSATSEEGGYPSTASKDGPIPHKSQQDTVRMMIAMVDKPDNGMVGVALPKNATEAEIGRLQTFRNEESSRFTQATTNHRLYSYVLACVMYYDSLLPNFLSLIVHQEDCETSAAMAHTGIQDPFRM